MANQYSIAGPYQDVLNAQYKAAIRPASAMQNDLLEGTQNLVNPQEQAEAAQRRQTAAGGSDPFHLQQAIQAKQNKLYDSQMNDLKRNTSYQAQLNKFNALNQTRQQYTGLASTLNQMKFAEQAQRAKEQAARDAVIGSIFGAGGAIAGGLIAGPAGAIVGGQVGSAAGGAASRA